VRKTFSWALMALLLVLSLTSCTSTNLPQLPETAKSVCHLYENAKPKVVALRAWAVANWDATVPGTDVPVIPAEVKATLTEFDRYLPEIDAAGQLICGFTAPAPSGGVGERLKSVPWDKVLAVTVKAVDLAVQYQAKKG
jgi:hypothetical protein